MGILSEFKSAVELAKETGNPELRQALLDAQGQVQEMYDDLLRLREDNQELRERVADLEKQLAVEEELEFNDGVYWRRTEEGGREGPFCHPCWSERGKLEPLRNTRHGSFFCEVCENNVPHDEARGSSTPSSIPTDL